jgi:hypothetical protein
VIIISTEIQWDGLIEPLQRLGSIIDEHGTQDYQELLAEDFLSTSRRY